MATIFKVLGQAAPSADTDTTLYTVPASTNTVTSTICIANRGAASATYRIAIRPAGAAIADTHFIAFDIPVNAKDTTALTLGLTLEATDVVTVRASTADTTFNLFGSEIS